MRPLLIFTMLTLPLPALARVPQVVTDIPPVQALVAQVMANLGNPVLLLEKGADEHDFQLRPSQMRAIADADLVVWIGPSLTPWLDRAMASAKGTSLTLLDQPNTLQRPYAAGGESQGIDPHAWMEPQNAIAWAKAIAASLAKADPEHSAVYAANAATAVARIAAMDADLTARLAPIKAKGFVTFHAAYGYFTAHYGLSRAAALTLGDAAAPGAAKLVSVQAQMRAGDYLCAFPEVQHDPALLNQVMAGTTVKLGAALDPVGSSLPFGPEGYDALMRSIATTLLDCLNR